MSSSPSKSVKGTTSKDDDAQEEKNKCNKRSLEEDSGRDSDDAKEQDSLKKTKLNFTLKSSVPTSSSTTKSLLKTGSLILSKKESPKPLIKPNNSSVFGDSDDEDDVEEMPAEARMRMKNIGRDTPTSAGPNSFGKTRQGFCDSKKVFERQLKKAMDDPSG